MRRSFIGIAILLQPGASLTVQLWDALRISINQIGLQGIGKQAVIAEPLVVLIPGNNEQISLLDPG